MYRCSAHRIVDEEQFNKRASKVIRHCIGIALLCSVLGAENSCHILGQSDAKLKPITTWSPASSRALGSLVLFTLSSPHWLLKLFFFPLVGRCDSFGFGCTTLNGKALKNKVQFHKERIRVQRGIKETV